MQYWISMNEIINKYLLAGDKFMPEIYLRHLRWIHWKYIEDNVAWRLKEAKLATKNYIANFI